MRIGLLILGLALVATAVQIETARAASVSVTGADGADGVKPPPTLYDPNSFFPFQGSPGQAGGAGEDANAVSNGVDAQNSATAVGGNGGDGSAGGDFVGAPPNSGYYGGSGGGGGAGGSATARAETNLPVGPTSATATAQGGSGGFSGAQGSPTYPGYFPNPVAANGGTATAQASTTTHDGPAQSTATASGGNGAAAESHANALTFGLGDAISTAIATGGNAATAQQPGGGATATADAVSDGGNAIANVQVTGGQGSGPYKSGPLVSDPVVGSAGGSISLVDAVHGSTAGKLSLIQQATGGAGVGGGAGQSELHAENPGGGELFAEAIGVGGDGHFVFDPHGGNAVGGSGFASVVGTDTHGAAVETHARAVGAIGGGFLGNLFGSAESHATAVGAGSLIARADSLSYAANDGRNTSRVATSEVVGVGAVHAARSDLSSTGGLFGFYGIHAESRMGAPTPFEGAQVPPSSDANSEPWRADLFAAPRAADVASWTAGNPSAQAVLQGESALALGNLAANGAQHASGSFELDLDAGSFALGKPLHIAFLDPVGGQGLDLLHLALSVDGNSVFDQSFSDGASALAALDDHVFDAPLGSPDAGLHHLVLSFELDLTGQGFAADFAVTPEPGAGLLLGLTLGLLGLRRGH